MFEHVRNHRPLLERIGGWLRPDGKLFVHVFCHRAASYAFETEGAANWMGRYFFTGGIMPSAQLLRRFPDVMRVEQQHAWNGRHYQRTADAWLANLDNHRAQVLPILAEAYGPGEARRWFNRWRTFFLAVSELFGFGDGDEWYVSHYLMAPAGSARTLDLRIAPGTSASVARL
jgi:cyclopropane-fatty-acyl-phospholipid synthase